MRKIQATFDKTPLFFEVRFDIVVAVADRQGMPAG
jgi:hypothetical protein